MVFCIKEMFLVESRSTYQYYLNKRTSCSDRCFIAAVNFDALMACIEIVYNTGAQISPYAFHVGTVCSREAVCSCLTSARPLVRPAFVTPAYLRGDLYGVITVNPNFL